MGSRAPGWKGWRIASSSILTTTPAAREFGNVNWIDSSACAVAEMIYRLSGRRRHRHRPVQMATCLYAAVLSDTGSFCYEGTDAHTFELARNLVSQGADPVRIAQDVYFSNPMAKIQLLGAALWPTCTTTDAWRGCGSANTTWSARRAAEEDCEGIVNYAIGIAGIEVAVFLRELPLIVAYA